MATPAEVTQEPRGFLRSERVWEDWGKTALLDLLTDNNDRFPFSAPLEEAAPNFENLDLTPGGMPLAFDNLDKAAFMTKATWRCAGSVKDAKKYCSFFARNICERWRVGGDLAQQAEAAFWRGFLEGRTAMQSEATLDYLKGQAEAYDAIRRGVVKEFIRRIRKLSDVKT